MADRASDHVARLAVAPPHLFQVVAPLQPDELRVRMQLDRLGDRWTILVLLTLEDAGTLRFTALRSKISDVSQRMLAQTLRRIERDGLVARMVYPTIPPRVEYSLTALGRSFLRPLRDLVSWARRNRDKVQKARATYQPPPQEMAL